MSDIEIVKTERIYKTSEALRRAVNKYNLSQEDYKQTSKNNYLLRRADPEYVLKCQRQCREYQEKKKEEKRLKKIELTI
jgi:hypothetical protein